MKKLLAGLSAAAVAASSMLTHVAVAAYSYADDAEYVAAFNWLHDNGLTSKDTPEAFMPGSTMLREHLSRFVTYFGLGNQCLEPDMDASCDFSDLSSADETLQKYITTSCQLGVLKGSQGMFMPGKSVTKAELATALVRMLDGEKSEDGPVWYANYFTAAKALGLTKDASWANWGNPVSRYEAALMLYRARDTQAQCDFDPTKIENDNDLWDWLEQLFGDGTTTTGTTDTGTTPVTSNGMVKAMLSDTTPAGGRVAGLTSLNVASFKLMGERDDTVLQTVTVERFGLNSSTAVSKVELEINGEVVGKSKSLNSDGKAVFSFSKPVTIKAGQHITVDVVATIGDSSGSSNQDFRMGLVAFDTNGSEDTSNLPLKGNEFIVAGVNGATAEISRDGTISDKALGTKQAEVAKFKIKNTNSNESIFISQVSLKDDENNADDDLRNFTLLKSDGTVLATTEVIPSNANNLVTFKFSTPLEIKQGQTVRFKLLADIVAGAADNIEFKVDRASNVKGYSSKLGLGIAVTYSDYTTNGGQQFSITAGQLTIVKNTLTHTKLLKNKEDFVIASFDFKVKTGANLTLENIGFVVAADNAAGTGFATALATLLENVQVKVNGAPNDLSASSTTSTGSVTFSDTDLGIPLTAGGTTKVELIVDSANAFAAGDLNKYFKVTLNTSGTSNLKIVENDDDKVVTDITPSVVTSDKIQVVDSAASVVALTLSTPFNAVVGSENVVGGDFQIRTTNAGSVAIQSIAFTGGTNFTSTLISQLKLWRQVGSTWQEIDAQAGFDISSSAVTFDNFDEIVIPASSTQNFRLTLDLVNGSSTGTIAALSVSSVSMQDGENNDITASTSYPVGLVRAITVTTAGSLSVTVDNTDANTNQSKSVVAGNTSDYVASYEFVANNEDVLIKDMTLTASGGSGVSMTNLSSIIKSVQVYEIGTNGATLLAEENTVNNLGYVEFNDFNKVIPQGTKNLYFKVVTQKYGQNFPGIDYLTGISFSLDIATTDAQGVSSNADISSAIDTDDSLPMFVFPIRVSDISFVTSYASRSVTTPTSPGSGLNLAIIKVTADNWSNTDSSDGSLLSMLINKIKVKNSSSYVSNLTMERIDISNGTVLTASGVGTTAIFHLTSGSTTDRQVGPSDVAYYLVKGDIGGIAAGSNATVRIDLENLDSGSFEFTHDGTSAGTYTALRLGFTKRDGIPVTVNN